MTATAGPLTSEQILGAAQDVLRRHGPSKANVVDVARALGVSHGSVYRHFPSKAALREAVAARWLAEISDPLEEIVTADARAPDRLRAWVERLSATKRERAADDPELFATYVALAHESGGAVAEHVDHLLDQLTRIVADGVARGELVAPDPAATARAIFDATARFHDPAHAGEWSAPGLDARFDGLWAMVEAGLTPRAAA
jgi:AcrR family transcriptional regulator